MFSPEAGKKEYQVRDNVSNKPIPPDKMSLYRLPFRELSVSHSALDTGTCSSQSTVEICPSPGPAMLNYRRKSTQ